VHPARLLLESGLILGVVALSGIFFRKLRLSTIPAYILLGLLLGPVVGRSELVEVFALWGVVLLLFFVGLEFSLPNLVASRKKLFRLGFIDLVINFPVGFIAGLLLGWGLLGALFIGGAFYISSSAIIARSVIELRRTAHPETEPALNILVFEDLAIAVLLAILSGIVLREGDVAAGLGGAVRAILFLSVIGLLAWLGRPLLNRLLHTDDDELFVLLMGAALLLISYAAVAVGVSEAIGAFLAGSVMAETEHKRRIESLFAPLQGLFAAMFFLAFGLSVDTQALKEVWLPAVILAIVAVPTKLFTGWASGRAEGLSPRASLALGFTLVPRGEFSIVLAGVAATAGFQRAPALITLFVLILAVLGTVLIEHGPTLTRWLRPQQTRATLEERGFDARLARHDES
jgi:CPA2 family monovalent cation:H+ antiporter-2